MHPSLLVSNIQRFSLHDGPGIRTTVFLAGCPLHCPWCCNPEAAVALSLDKVPKDMLPAQKEFEEVYSIIMRDRIFYGKDGGVTFSGGEPLAQIEKLKPLLQKLSAEGISIVFETSLFATASAVETAMHWADGMLVDIKILDSLQCMSLLGGNIDVFLQNIELIKDSPEKIVARIPIITGYTDSEENRQRVIQLLNHLRPSRVELLKGHNFACSKYDKLGLDQPKYKEIDLIFLEEYRKLISDLHLDVTVASW